MRILDCAGAEILECGRATWSMEEMRNTEYGRAENPWTVKELRILGHGGAENPGVWKR